MIASRIVFVNRFFHPDQSATSRLLSDLAFQLAKDGRRISVITARGLYEGSRVGLPQEETVAGVAIHRVYQPRFSRVGLFGRALDYVAMYLTFFVAAWRLTRPGDVLVAKTDPPLLGVALTPVAYFKRLKLVHWLQDLYPEVALTIGMKTLAPVAPLLICARNASLRSARRTVVIGVRMQQFLQAAGVDPARTTVIENWCDDAAIRPLLDTQSQLRESWSLRNKFVVAYSGNLGRAHEYDTLLGAADLLRAQEDIVFLFIGGGYLAPRLKRDVAKRGLEPAFRFLPYQPEDMLAQSLGAADIHWLSQPAPMEGLILPSKFYGVAAAGRPLIVIGDPTGELGELIRRHDCGTTVAQGDSTALADYILSLRDHPTRAPQMGANARSMLDNNFTRAQAMSRWSKLFDSL